MAMDVMSLTLPQEGWGVVHGRDKQVVARVRMANTSLSLRRPMMIGLSHSCPSLMRRASSRGRPRRSGGITPTASSIRQPFRMVASLARANSIGIPSSADFLRIPVEGARMSSIHIYHPQKTISSLMDRVTVRLGGRKGFTYPSRTLWGPKGWRGASRKIASTIAVLEAISR